MQIKRDRHGLYVCVDGFLFRPEHSVYTINKGSVNLGESSMSAGQRVTAQCVAQSPFVTVTGADGSEFWCSHGPTHTFLNQKISSEAVWRPADEPEPVVQTDETPGRAALVEARLSSLHDYLSRSYGKATDVEASLMLIADVMRHAERAGLDPKTILKMAEGFYDAENRMLEVAPDEHDGPGSRC